MSSRMRDFDPGAPRADRPTKQDSVEDTLARLRAHLEPIWIDWKNSMGRQHGSCPSSMACIPTACTVTALLGYLHPQGRWRTVGGRPTTKTPMGGYGAADGGIPHLWTSGRLGGIWIVADLTADQFGGPEVVFGPAAALPYRANSTRTLMRWYEEHEGATVIDWSASFLFAEGADAVLGFLQWRRQAKESSLPHGKSLAR